MLMCVYQKNGALTMHYTPLPLNSASLKGAGTAEDPYQLACASDFRLIDNNPSAYYEVVNDIDFLGEPFEGPKKAFLGKLDGKDYTWKNLCLVGGGLFGEVKDSVTIANIKMENPTLVMTGANDNVAGILANIMQGGISDEGVNIPALLSNVHVTNPVIKGVGYNGIVGTLVGEAALFLDVNTCSVAGAELTAPAAQVGGIIGKSATSTNIYACVFTGVAEGKVVGGITSEVSSGEPVYDCRVDADLYTNYTAGGIVGYSGRSLISNCVAEGTLTLDANATIGKVGGIVGEVETDATGSSTAILVENCLVGISSINVPECKDVVAHRVVGFSSGDDYEYDWDNVDWSKPQSEWPRLYFAAEKNFKNNYVISDLAPVDATIQLTDTTTEGATLAWSEVTTAWLGEHGYKLGTSVDAPWAYSEQLTLWFESELNTGLEDIFGGNCGDINGGKPAAKKIIINGQILIIRDGKIYNAQGVQVQ